ncbi:serine/threonine-protein phosphatase 6 regulatory ankyrin repeat subunit A-like isoform X2 [Schistocerca nitens]|uniref:serine/threonine-protein phosphatase 6 regulatory ankyrin repeat subunit A-like isoform X2 n=1 Tax=Schistocerca nitens TaxID=7011 RepID=UPI002118F354|nr:serine/threonine-protein phosphatase 6 regulatory ankyrin repeat subunit A-like isoform X2 [Schistocerca nitens]
MLWSPRESFHTGDNAYPPMPLNAAVSCHSGHWAESTTMAAGDEAQHSTPVYLGALLDDGEGATVTLAAGETRLVVHRAVLAAGSPVFAAMFRHDTAESRGGLVDVADVDGPVLRELVTYLYTLRAPQLASLAARLLVAADKYGVASLKAQCEQQLAAGLTVDNAAATAVLAVRHCCPGLRQAAVSYVKGHTHRVMATQGWADAVRTQPEDVVQLSGLLAETPPESSPGPSAATQPPSGAAARHTPPPPDDAAVSRLRSLSQQERGRRLIEAARQGAAEQLRELLAAGADVGARGYELGTSFTALHLAARGGHVEAASCLVGAGAEVNARSSQEQRTPLHSAARWGHAGVVRLLVGASADLNARDWLGQTPLHRAAEEGHAEAAAELLMAGANRGAMDVGGRTPMDFARQSGKQQLVDMLTQR